MRFPRRTAWWFPAFYQDDGEGDGTSSTSSDARGSVSIGTGSGNPGPGADAQGGGYPAVGTGSGAPGGTSTTAPSANFGDAAYGSQFGSADSSTNPATSSAYGFPGFGQSPSNIGMSSAAAAASGLAAADSANYGSSYGTGMGSIGPSSGGYSQYGGTPGANAYGTSVNSYGSNVSQGGGFTNSTTALNSQNQNSLNSAANVQTVRAYDELRALLLKPQSQTGLTSMQINSIAHLLGLQAPTSGTNMGYPAQNPSLGIGGTPQGTPSPYGGLLGLPSGGGGGYGFGGGTNSPSPYGQQDYAHNLTPVQQMRLKNLNSGIGGGLTQAQQTQLSNMNSPGGLTQAQQTQLSNMNSPNAVAFGPRASEAIAASPRASNAAVNKAIAIDRGISVPGFPYGINTPQAAHPNMAVPGLPDSGEITPTPAAS